MAVTESKHRSWGLGGEVVESAVDVHFTQRPLATLLRGFVCNNSWRGRTGGHASALSIPMRIVGHNPEMPGVRPSRDWDDLKALLSRHRFFVHTANPMLEDVNMALMEAAAAGLPILGNRHRVAPVEHGVEGFLSDDPLSFGCRMRCSSSPRRRWAWRRVTLPPTVSPDRSSVR